ncbi:uncharacterized protein LOC111712312 [Eurytemora carolleeae]|uniref:uncharacterized protein LOC111712312 n=1 Tax=Eurytemora carolleeae TaxID=1294199 RepID=UPI000C762E7A|nr:uncharacterized protein LOC111712312 [Eurytemora carolleeae]|eukprot:XP_023342654.1 uncharacterized protein LOC111712312 [Eurytemora affinis]
MKSLMGNLRNMFGSVTKRMMNVRPSINSLLSSSPSLEPILSNPLPASSHPTANPHPPAVLHTAVHGGDSERSIGIGIRKLETGLIPPRYKQKDISLKEDFFSQEMLKMRKLFPSEKKIDRSGADSTGTRRNTRKEKVSENRNWSFRGNRRSNVPSKIIRGLQRKKEIDSRRNHGEDKKRRVEDTEKSWGGRMDIGENRKQWTDLLMSPTN